MEYGRFGPELYRASVDATGAFNDTIALLKLASNQRDGADEEGAFVTDLALVVGRGTGSAGTLGVLDDNFEWIACDRFGGAFTAPTKRMHLWMDFNDPVALTKIPSESVERIVVDWSTWRYMTPLKPTHQLPKQTSVTESSVRSQNQNNSSSTSSLEKLAAVNPPGAIQSATRPYTSMGSSNSAANIHSSKLQRQFSVEQSTYINHVSDAPHHSPQTRPMSPTIAQTHTPSPPPVPKSQSIKHKLLPNLRPALLQQPFQQQSDSSVISTAQQQEHQQLILDEWKRILKPGGTLIFEATISSVLFTSATPSASDSQARKPSSSSSLSIHKLETESNFSWDFDNPSHITISKQWAQSQINRLQHHSHSNNSNNSQQNLPSSSPSSSQQNLQHFPPIQTAATTTTTTPTSRPQTPDPQPLPTTSTSTPPSSFTPYNKRFSLAPTPDQAIPTPTSTPATITTLTSFTESTSSLSSATSMTPTPIVPTTQQEISQLPKARPSSVSGSVPKMIHHHVNAKLRAQTIGAGRSPTNRLEALKSSSSARSLNTGFGGTSCHSTSGLPDGGGSASQTNLGFGGTRRILPAPVSRESFLETQKREIDRRITECLYPVLDSVYTRIFVDKGGWNNLDVVVRDETLLKDVNGEDWKYPIPTKGWVSRWIKVTK
ncbi:UNVERIFIED_CONTAM: hypothetical protein HDU68_003023 [Siphonaria sp. JEL0065]|nr:hypothetical protein HDU68_003023 [Siphonaria sp. JEL0065]